VFLVNLCDLGPLCVSPFQKYGTRTRFSPISSHQKVSGGNHDYLVSSSVDMFMMRREPQTTSADQTVGLKSSPPLRKNASALEDRTAETRPAQGQLSPAAGTRCGQRLLRILLVP
jgi:hypothetical protein